MRMMNRISKATLRYFGTSQSFIGGTFAVGFINDFGCTPVLENTFNGVTEQKIVELIEVDKNKFEEDFGGAFSIEGKKYGLDFDKLADIYRSITPDISRENLEKLIREECLIPLKTLEDYFDEIKEIHGYGKSLIFDGVEYDPNLEELGRFYLDLSSRNNGSEEEKAALLKQYFFQHCITVKRKQ